MQSEPSDRFSVPRLAERPSLSLGPVEAFVLSKVDGRRSISDLAALVGLPRAEVEAILHRLEAAGALIIDVQALESPESLGSSDVELVTDGDRESSRPTTPSADPFAHFDRATSPGIVSDELLRVTTQRS